ncbi:MAG: phytoene desaturase [Gemmatimonadaceae bacterium]|nr:phytoene desaturase [Gemmatimonadaceae bacterium]
MRIVVIGSGFGGLAAAIRLQGQGHDVTIVEKLDKPGGRAYVFEQDGYTFDAGPTIITAPWMIDEIFAAAGKRTADYVSIVPVDPYYRLRWEDGSVFNYNGDRGELLRQVREFSPADADQYEKFYAKTEDIFNTGMPLVDAPFNTLGDFLKVVPDLVRLRSDQSVARMVNAKFRDERLRQLFSFHPLLIGGNPYAASSLYALVHALEQKWGVHFAMGGTGALVRALVRCFRDIGGTVRLNSEVAEILVDDRTNESTGVRLASGEVLAADTVVCNGEVAHSYMKLVPARYRKVNTDRKYEKYDYAMSLFVIYFGTNRQYEDVAHHEILMGPRYKELLADIFDRKVLADDFSLYLHRPTATDPSLAPAGHDCWYVLSPVPHLGSGTDWATTYAGYRDRILRYLEERYLPNLSQHLTVVRHIDPRYFRDTLNSHLGSAFSVEPTLLQSAWMRPHNRSQDIPNLYFCGAGTHPGAGLPGVMGSGKIVADLIGSAPIPFSRGRRHEEEAEAEAERLSA